MTFSEVSDVRPQTLIIILLALGLVLVSPPARAADPDSEDDDESEDGEDKPEQDASTQAGPPKVRLDNAKSPMLDRRMNPKFKDAQSKASGDSGGEEKSGDDDNNDEDDPDKGLAGQDSPVPGGGDGQWSTSGSVSRKPVERAPRDTLVNIDFVESDLKDVIKYFAEITGRNFIIAEKLSGKITIISPTPVTIAEAYEAFISALDSSGFTTVTEGKVTRIVNNRSSMKEPIRLYKDDYLPYTANIVTRIMRLENVSADDLAKIASKMVGDGGDVTTYASTNSLIITDSANNIRRIEELLTELDVSAPSTKLEVIELGWADATEIVTKIKDVFDIEESAVAPAANNERNNRRSSRSSRRNKDKPDPTPAAQGATSDQVGSQSYIKKVLADERTNSVIIMATERGLDDVKEFIARLDYEMDVSSDIHVIYLEHADAEELSQVLSALTQDSNSRAQTNTRAGGRATASKGATDKGSSSKKSASAGKGGLSVAEFENNVKVTADVATNSLVITASSDDFRRLRRVIDMLDIRRKQVFVEAVIMEVSDNKERDTGISYHTGYAKDEVGQSGMGLGGVGSVGGSTLMSAFATDPTSIAMDLSGMALGVFGSAIPVSFMGMDLDIPAFGIILTAMETDTSTEVLSAPNLLTLDNEEAEIIVGQTIPFSSGFTTTTQGMPISNFSREDVALTLRITPQINESDIVTLEIFQEITEVVPGSESGDLMSSGGVTTTKRSVETVISVRNNQTIVLGGLMQTSETLGESKVPFLGDLPLLGALFKNKKKTDKKTNLLLFLTPHVIDEPEDLQEVYLIKMVQRQEFLRRFYGKSLEDKQRELNDLLMYSMNLPDIPPAYEDRPPNPRLDSDDWEDYAVDDERPTGSVDVNSVHETKEDSLPDSDDYEDDYEDEDTDEDDYEDEDTDEERTGDDTGGDGGTETTVDEASYVQPGEMMLTPGGGEIRFQGTPAEGN